MSPAFAAVTETVRRHDPDRYFATLFAPRAARAPLMALYAFNHEVARVGESVREPMMGEIRLAWWRETVEGARAGQPRSHDVAAALAQVLRRHDLPDALFARLIEARSFDVGPETFATLAELEAYARATAGTLIALAARLLGEERDRQAEAAGMAYGLTGLLRALPHHAARGKLFLPMELMARAGLSPQELFAGHGDDRLKMVMGEVAARVRAHLAQARGQGRLGRALAAFLPVTLAPLYLDLMTAKDFAPFRDVAQRAQARRQWALLGAALRGNF